LLGGTYGVAFTLTVKLFTMVVILALDKSVTLATTLARLDITHTKKERTDS
jgi:hypothetical protein